jgi:hypothetical protein
MAHLIVSQTLSSTSAAGPIQNPYESVVLIARALN